MFLASKDTFPMSQNVKLAYIPTTVDQCLSVRTTSRRARGGLMVGGRRQLGKRSGAETREAVRGQVGSVPVYQETQACKSEAEGR